MTSNIVARSKQAGVNPMQTSEVLNEFLNSESLEAMRRAVEMAEDRLYMTWASVDARDRDGERIPIERIIEQQDTLLDRGGPVQDMHTNRNVGRTLAYRVFEHPETKTLGVLHLNKIFNNFRVDDKVWQETVSGERTGSSVGGTIDNSSPISYVKEEDGQMTPLLDSFEQHETSNVYKPANPWATNEAVSLVAKAAKDINIDTPSDSSQTAKSDADDTQKTTNGKFKMTEEIEKQLSEIQEAVSKNSETIEKLAELQLANKADEEKPPKDDEDEEMEKKKEDASSMIDGEHGKESPEAPHPEDSNDLDTIKAELEELKKLAKAQSELIKTQAEASTPKQKSTTPRPGAPTPSEQSNSVQDLRKTAVELALGQKRDSWANINKMVRDLDEAQSQKIADLAKQMVV